MLVYSFVYALSSEATPLLSYFDLLSISALLTAIVLALLAFLLYIYLCNLLSSQTIKNGTTSYVFTHTKLSEYIATNPDNELLNVQKDTTQQTTFDHIAQALEQGDPRPAIMAFAENAQKYNPDVWESLWQIVAQAHTTSIQSNIKNYSLKEAFNALQLSITDRSNALYHCCTALVLYRWLLNELDSDSIKAADAWYNIGCAYSNLPVALSTNVEAAIACYNIALPIYARNHHNQAYAATLHNLGNAYCNFFNNNRQTNLEVAITCYIAALKFYTLTATPKEWTITQHNLGNAYHVLPSGKRDSNLDNAIKHYENALKGYQEQHSIEWARIHYELGLAFSYLPIEGESQQDHLKQAISHYEYALQFYWAHPLPIERARTCYELGLAYIDLKIGQQQVNLKNAANVLEEALKFYETQESTEITGNILRNLVKINRNLVGVVQQDTLNKIINYYQSILKNYQSSLSRNSQALIDQKDLAAIQRDLGDIYLTLQYADRYTNLNLALRYYQEALKVFTSQNFPMEHAYIHYNLGNAYRSSFMEVPDKLTEPRIFLKNAREHYQIAFDIYNSRNMKERAQDIQEYLNYITQMLQRSERR